jgi:hypothetical protein
MSIQAPITMGRRLNGFFWLYPLPLMFQRSQIDLKMADIVPIVSTYLKLLNQYWPIQFPAFPGGILCKLAAHL